VVPIQLIKLQGRDFTGSHPVDRQQHQDCTVAHVTTQIGCAVGQDLLHIRPTGRKRKRFELVDPWATNRLGQARITRPLGRRIAHERPQRRRDAGGGDPAPPLCTLADKIVVNVGRVQIR
jgi:hypothetical protein